MIVPPLAELQPGLRAVMSQGKLHLQLVQVEWLEEKRRLRQMLMLLIIGFCMFLCTLLGMSALVLALTWETPYRLHSIGSLCLFFAVGSAIAFYRFQENGKQAANAFADSRREIAADLALFRNWMDL